MIDEKTNITSNMVEYNCQYLKGSEIRILMNISKDKDFIQSMDILKKKNIEKFNQKMYIYKAQMQEQREQYEKLQSQPQKQELQCIPKCPTCGSTNIKKISGTKRWLTTGILGLASSDVGKTMQCNKCGYKW